MVTIHKESVKIEKTYKDIENDRLIFVKWENSEIIGIDFAQGIDSQFEFTNVDKKLSYLFFAILETFYKSEKKLSEKTLIEAINKTCWLYINDNFSNGFEDKQ